MTRRCNHRGQHAGFSLVEIVVAMGIVAAGLLSALALLAIASGEERIVEEQLRSAQLADSVFQELQATDPGSPPWSTVKATMDAATSPLWIPLVSRIYDSDLALILSTVEFDEARYHIEVLFLFDPEIPQRRVFSARVTTPWYAAAPNPGVPSGTVPPPPAGGVGGAEATVRKFTSAFHAP